MEQAEITQGNKLLGLFIGFEFIDDDPKYYPDGYYQLNKGELGHLTITDFEEYTFSEDWNLLHDVWGEFKNLKLPLKHSLDHIEYMIMIKQAMGENWIKETFKTLVSAVQWYNSTKETSKEI